MKNIVTTKQTSLSGEEVITRAIQFFSNEKWRATTQSTRTATFEGKPPIPVFYLFLTMAGLFFFIIPGIILYIRLVKKMHRFQNLVVTVSPNNKGCEVVITCSSTYAKKMTDGFVEALPD